MLFRSQQNKQLIKGILASGLYPQIKTIERYRKMSFMVDNSKRIYINQKSVINEKMLLQPFMAYFGFRANRKGNVHALDCTALESTPVRLFTPLSGAYEDTQLRQEIQDYVSKCLAQQIVPSSTVPTTIVRVLQKL